MRRIVLGVAEARCRGEQVADTDILARYPDLAADLPDALRFAGVLTAAFDRSGSDGPLEGPLPVLTDEELDAPIELLVPGAPPSIEGYDLAEEVGRGGQGVVYRGTERTGGRAVAVKVLPGGHFSDARARSRFARETRILYRLRCPGVVTATGHGRTADGSLYLVMPYVDGVPLDGHAARAAGGDAAVALLFAEVADVVQAVHAAGVVHRDLKPSNVRVDRDGRPHVLDFGLAGSTATGDASRSLTGSHQILGSLPWASPEQARGDADAVDTRSDVYAMGLMLAHAIGGGPPYPVDGPPHAVVDRILHARPRVPGRPDGDPLAAAALRCLAKRPADRYPTAASLAADLRRVAAGGRPAGGRRSTRRTVWMVALPAVLAASVTLAFTAARRADRSTSARSPADKAARRNTIGIPLRDRWFGRGPAPRLAVVPRDHRRRICGRDRVTGIAAGRRPGPMPRHARRGRLVLPTTGPHRRPLVPPAHGRRAVGGDSGVVGRVPGDRAGVDRGRRPQAVPRRPRGLVPSGSGPEGGRGKSA